MHPRNEGHSAASHGVLLVVILASALIGGIGAGVGLVLGLALCYVQLRYQLVSLTGAESFIIDAYPVAVEAFDIAVVTAIALVLCMLAALYPAARASSIEPAVAVRTG